MQTIPHLYLCLHFLLCHTRRTKPIYLKFCWLLLSSPYFIRAGWYPVSSSRRLRCRKHPVLSRKRPVCLSGLKSHWLLMTQDHQEQKSMLHAIRRLINQSSLEKMHSSLFSRLGGSWDSVDKNHITFTNILSACMDSLVLTKFKQLLPASDLCLKQHHVSSENI